MHDYRYFWMSTKRFPFNYEHKLLHENIIQEIETQILQLDSIIICIFVYKIYKYICWEVVKCTEPEKWSKGKKGKINPFSIVDWKENRLRGKPIETKTDSDENWLRGKPIERKTNWMKKQAELKIIKVKK